MSAPEMWDGELFDFDQLRATAWPYWWTVPVLIFAGITGPGGYWLLDPSLVGAMPAPLYFAALGAVLLALGTLAIAGVLVAIWTVDQFLNALARDE